MPQRLKIMKTEKNTILNKSKISMSRQVNVCVHVVHVPGAIFSL